MKKDDKNKSDQTGPEENEEIVDIEYEDQQSITDKIKKIREKLKKCEVEKQEYLQGWQRQKADAINEKKRLTDQINTEREKGKEDAVLKILPILDSFNMAFKGEAWDKVDDVWKKGVEYIHKQFESALEDLDVQMFCQEGDKFDPQLHESIKEIHPEQNSQKGKIAKVLRQGYKFKSGKVIRPAQVEVYSD